MLRPGFPLHHSGALGVHHSSSSCASAAAVVDGHLSPAVGEVPPCAGRNAYLALRLADPVRQSGISVALPSRSEKMIPSSSVVSVFAASQEDRVADAKTSSTFPPFPLHPLLPSSSSRIGVFILLSLSAAHSIHPLDATLHPIPFSTFSPRGVPSTATSSACFIDPSRIAKKTGTSPFKKKIFKKKKR